MTISVFRKITTLVFVASAVLNFSVLTQAAPVAAKCGQDTSSGEVFTDSFKQGFNSCFYLTFGTGFSHLSPTVDASLSNRYKLDKDIAGALNFTIGYRHSYRWFAEGNVTYLGTAGLKSNLAGDKAVFIRYTATSLVLGRYLLDDRGHGFNPFARAGVVYTQFEPDDLTLFSKGNSTNVLVGGGVDYRSANSPWFFRLSADFYESDVQTTALSIGRFLGGDGAAEKLSVYESDQDIEDVLVDAENGANATENTTIKEILAGETPTVNQSSREVDCQMLDDDIDVTFAIGESQLDDKAITVLANYVEVFKRNSDLIVEVRAHTHGSADPDIDLALTKSQAQAIVDYLVSQDVDKTKLIVRGYGAKRPLDTTGTLEAQAKNRRIEFRVMNISECYR